MKRVFLVGWLTFALARVALGQASSFYINNGQLNAPPSDVPQIDATNFVNNGLFNINLTPVFNQGFNFNSGPAFDFSDTQNFTNTGSMFCNFGFLFENQPPGNGPTNMSVNFINTSTGAIYANSANAAFEPFISTTFPTMSILASNVVSPGTLDVGVDGLLNIIGNHVDLSRGSLGIDGVQSFNNLVGFFSFFNNNSTTFADFGIFPDYWGLGTQSNLLRIANVTLPNPSSPIFQVTNFPSYGTGNQNIFVPGATAFANTNQVNASNFTYQVVFVGGTNTNITVSVGFEDAGADFAVPTVQWLSVITNNFGIVTTNTFYLQDFFGAETNFSLVTTFIGNGDAPLFSPINYVYTPFDPTGDFSFLPTGNATYDPATFFTDTGGIPNTNQYAALEVLVQPETFQPDPTIPGQTLFNIPGRIVLNASNYMDLTLATVFGPNYLNVTSTNHFVGSAQAQIESPNMDVNVGTTNGLLFVTNLVAPFLPRFNGTIDTYSARWTNVINGVTNAFHILMVDSRLQATALPLVQNFLVRSTNVFISDVVNVASNLLINATSLTITSNAPGSPAPVGELNLISPNIIWSNSLPALKFLTNSGIIIANNTTYFAEVENPPYFPNSFNGPYQAVVNHGSISTFGNTIWANYFENTGSGVTTNTNNFPITISTNIATMASSFGPISIQSPTAIMENGGVFVTNGSLTITAGNLTISNVAMHCSGALTFSPTNQFNVGGSTWTNVWSVSNGFNLLIKPPTGDLLGTVLVDTSPTNVNKLVSHTWAGNDFGVSTAGFFNNVALGQLILNGRGVNCTFSFSGSDANPHALYVDQIELLNFATNITNPSVGYTAFSVDPNMMIYFADAMASGQDISERLDGSANGHVRWVPAFSGVFSGTNIVMGGVTNPLVNRALVMSKDIDSNGSGTNNFFQLQSGSYPIFNSANVNLAVAHTNHLGTNSVVISWEALFDSTNYLRYKTSLTGTNWITLTNFVQGPANSRVTVIDPVQANGKRYYKVEIDPQQP